MVFISWQTPGMLPHETWILEDLYCWTWWKRFYGMSLASSLNFLQRTPTLSHLKMPDLQCHGRSDGECLHQILRTAHHGTFACTDHNAIRSVITLEVPWRCLQTTFRFKLHLGQNLKPKASGEKCCCSMFLCSIRSTNRHLKIPKSINFNN